METSPQPLPLCFLRSHSKCELIGHQHPALILTSAFSLQTAVCQNLFTTKHKLWWVYLGNWSPFTSDADSVGTVQNLEVTSISYQLRVCEFLLGAQQIPNKPQQIPLSSFTAQYFPLRYWQFRVPLLLGRNSSARIQAAWLRTSVTPIDTWNWSKQKAKQESISESG